MTTIYICASFKLLNKTKMIAKSLLDSGMTAIFSEPDDPKGIDGCTTRIDQADVVYINNPGGVIGKSVSFDLGYAVAKGKTIYSLERIDDPPISHLIEDPADPDSLARVLEQCR